VLADWPEYICSWLNTKVDFSYLKKDFPAYAICTIYLADVKWLKILWVDSIHLKVNKKKYEASNSLNSSVIGIIWKLRVAKGLCMTRDKGYNLYVTHESYLKRNVSWEYLNARDAWFVSW